jgi:hypothetical protein
VDNNSSDGSQEYVEREFPWVVLHQNRGNPGFAAANNQVLSQAISDYVFLLNPDTVLRPGAMERLVRVLRAHPEAGCAAPMLLNPDGTLQLSLGRFPSIANQLIECLALHRIGLRGHEEIVRSPSYYARPREIDWAYGAALLTRREVIEEVGLLDEGFFFGSEERDWCYRLKRAGWKVLYEPAAQVVHFGRGWRRDPALTEALVRGRLRFAEKHFSRPKAELLRLITALGLLGRGGVSLAGRLVRRRDEGHRLRCRACWRALKACAVRPGGREEHPAG